MKTIWIIIKKELKRYFTDFRMLLGILLPGVLIFLLYTVMGNFINQNDTIINQKFTIYIVHEPEEFSFFFQASNFEIKQNEKNLDKEEILLQISDKKIDLYVVYEPDFFNHMMAYQSSSLAPAPNIEIYYNSASDSSLQIYNYYVACLTQFETQMTNKFDINAGDTLYDQAKKEDITIKIFTMMLPFLLVTLLFSGAMGICSESIAGEKERGTIATLLITPAKRSEIAIGKVLSLGIVSLASSLVSFLGLIASLPKLAGENISLNAYGFSTILMLLVVILFTVLLFTVLLTLVSTFAKSVKEASSFSIPVMILVMLLGATSFMGTQAQTNPLLYFVPVYSSIQSLIGILSQTIKPSCFLIFIVSSALYLGVGVFVLTKMFNSEKIMFNK